MFRRGRLLEVLAKSLRQQADHHYRQQSRGAEFGDGRHTQGQPKNEHSADSWFFHVPIQGVDPGEVWPRLLPCRWSPWRRVPAGSAQRRIAAGRAARSRRRTSRIPLRRCKQPEKEVRETHSTRARSRTRSASFPYKNWSSPTQSPALEENVVGGCGCCSCIGSRERRR